MGLCSLYTTPASLSLRPNRREVDIVQEMVRYYTTVVYGQFTVRIVDILRKKVSVLSVCGLHYRLAIRRMCVSMCQITPMQHLSSCGVIPPWISTKVTV